MRRNNVFWGLIAIIAGVILLLNSLGYMPDNFWQIFWPSILIFLGLWFLVGPYIFRRSLEPEQLVIPLEGARQAEIKLRHGAGRINLEALAGGGELLSGSFVGGVEHRLHRHGDLLRLKLKASSDFFFGLPPVSGFEGLAWKIGLNPDIPVTLDVKTGASEAELNLTDLKVSELRLSTGASATRITMPARAGFTRAQIESGAASVELRLPDGVAGRIRVKSGLAGVNIDTSRFHPVGDGYESPDYAAAENKAEINVETGVASVEIR